MRGFIFFPLILSSLNRESFEQIDHSPHVIKLSRPGEVRLVSVDDIHTTGFIFLLSFSSFELFCISSHTHIYIHYRFVISLSGSVCPTTIRVDVIESASAVLRDKGTERVFCALPQSNNNHNNNGESNEQQGLAVLLKVR